MMTSQGTESTWDLRLGPTAHYYIRPPATLDKFGSLALPPATSRRRRKQKSRVESLTAEQGRARQDTMSCSCWWGQGGNKPVQSNSLSILVSLSLISFSLQTWALACSSCLYTHTFGSIWVLLPLCQHRISYSTNCVIDCSTWDLYCRLA